MTESDFDAELFRKPHESSHEWDLRKSFILAHHDLFPCSRLLCLANCFVNIECYGCQYPAEVMKQMEELGSVARAGIYRRKPMIGQPSGVKFVKSSDGADKKTNPSASSGEEAISVEETSETERSQKCSMNSIIPVESPVQMSAMASKFYTLANSSSPAESPVQMSAMASKFYTLANSSSPAESTVQMSAMASKFYTLANHIRIISEKTKSAKNDAEIIQMAADKAKMVITSKFSNNHDHNRPVQGFNCELLIDHILISCGEASKKKAARHLAFQKATELLCRPYLKIEKLDDYRLVGSIEPFEALASSVDRQAVKRRFDTPTITKLGQETETNIHCLAKRQKHTVGEKLKSPTGINTVGENQKRPTGINAVGEEQKRPTGGNTIGEKQKIPTGGLEEVLAEFVIMEQGTNALKVLNQSGSLCKSEFGYEFFELPDGKTRCEISLKGIVLVDFVGESKQSSKLGAAELALEMLKKKCYTIIMKQLVETDARDAIQRETVINDTLLKQAIPDSNIGNQLLKKIGWTGGGLGKEGNVGIVEPVSLESVINRSGLGLSAKKGVCKDFVQKISIIIQEYMNSEKQEDLFFSATFTKEERAIIHQQAKKYQLRNKSYGSNDDRYIVLSRKRTPIQLIAHIRANGGQTNKYILKSPGSS